MKRCMYTNLAAASCSCPKCCVELYLQHRTSGTSRVTRPVTAPVDENGTVAGSPSPSLPAPRLVSRTSSSHRPPPPRKAPALGIPDSPPSVGPSAFWPESEFAPFVRHFKAEREGAG